MTTLTRQAGKLDARESGVWVTLRYPFITRIFVEDAWIDAALRAHKYGSMSLNRERVAMNIAIGIRYGSYQP